MSSRGCASSARLPCPRPLVASTSWRGPLQRQRPTVPACGGRYVHLRDLKREGVAVAAWRARHDSRSFWVRVIDTPPMGGGGPLGVEVDGPTHYAEASASSSARRRRDTKTRLRDAFLRRRTKTLVVVPWFESEEAGKRGVEGQNAYLRAKLRDAGVEA